MVGILVVVLQDTLVVVTLEFIAFVLIHNQIKTVINTFVLLRD